MSATRSRPDTVCVVIEQRDRYDVADALFTESRQLEADALTRRRSSPVRKKLIERAFRLHELAARIRP
jgi:hypothetical protein